ncbi:nucleoside hydrolase [Pseudalkalibacillus hwajinpoensis]|uniref:Nucleoside hydrolase n=1 Tax=Guptibacillus hwajinpoensis TaxID=208199 RepID=A0A4U1MMU4_9BACL|nr:nucleoside hydrolase [Pseudalkalibacillus hwajinpoensis]TKD72071.1 nucleoside hydrolase [Pseudalkalibacillus hwajinpoensis]
MGRKVLFFGDVGIDDTVALIYAYLSNDIDVIGIVACYGNVSKKQTTRNVRYLLEKIGRTDIPVMGGAEKPMTGEVPVFYPDVHGPQGLGPISPPPANALALENFFEVIGIIEKYSDLVIVNVGRMTSLATLFLLYPDTMKSINSFYIMGGAFNVPGNVTPSAEANFYADPVAANIVMRYAENVFLYPLNVTQNAIVTPGMVNYINRKDRTHLLKPLLDYYYEEFYKKKVPGIEGAPVHDALTLMGVREGKMCEFYRTAVAVEISGEARGLSIGDFRKTFDPHDFDGRPIHSVAISLDYLSFYKSFMGTMSGDEF